MFVCKNLKHQYNSSIVLQIDQWRAEQGEHWLLLGPSGCGKTTLLYLLAGLLRPTSGELTVAGQNLSVLSPAVLDRWRGQNIGLIPQKLHLVASLNVLDNLLLGFYLSGNKIDRDRATTVLTAVGLSEKLSTYPAELSYGQAQRVAIARALINQPQLILADEPTANLDDIHCTKVLDLLLQEARNVQATLVVATHDARVKSTISKQRVMSVGES